MDNTELKERLEVLKNKKEILKEKEELEKEIKELEKDIKYGDIINHITSIKKAVKSLGKGIVKTFDKLVPPMTAEEKIRYKELQKKDSKNLDMFPDKINVMGNKY